MRYIPEMHHRRSIRLKGFDYSRFGAYFFTVCTQERECLFGDIVGTEMLLNNAGRMVKKCYVELENKFPDIKCDEHVIMPNHFHAIIQNVGADPAQPNPARREHVGADLRVCPNDERPEHTEGEHTGSPLRRVVQWFKTMTTNEYIRGVKQNNWPPFPAKLWQRNYYERIIRNENELNRIREYIINNPRRWETDLENPDVRAGSESASTKMDEPWQT